MTFTSPYLSHITGDSETFLRNTDCFVFPIGTDREEIIDTLESYCKAKQLSRVRTYEAIGLVLLDNCFQEFSVVGTERYINLSLSEIEVEF